MTRITWRNVTWAILLALSFAVLCLSGCANNTIASLDTLTDLDAVIDASPADIDIEFYADKVCLYKIRYQSDDCEVVGYVAAPVDYKEKRYPILIYNRGGNREFGALSPYEVALAAMPIDQNLAVENNIPADLGRDPQDCTKGGYIVLASQYRGVDGGTGMEQFGGDDIHDVIKLIDISERLAFAQQGGVYMMGFSRGGMMTYIACRDENRIKAAAVGSGISNAFDGYSERGADMKVVFTALIGGTPEQLPEEYEKRSAVLWADEIDVPMFIGHGGERDWRVLTHHATDMAAKLAEYGKDHKLVIYEEADHNLGMDFWFDVDQWFAAHPIR